MIFMIMLLILIALDAKTIFTNSVISYYIMFFFNFVFLFTTADLLVILYREQGLNSLSTIAAIMTLFALSYRPAKDFHISLEKAKKHVAQSHENVMKSIQETKDVIEYVRNK